MLSTAEAELPVPGTSKVPFSSPAQLFNSHICAAALAAATDLGLLEHLQDHGTIDLNTWSESNNLDLPTLRGIASALAAFGIVGLQTAESIQRGEMFSEAFRYRGFFRWLIGGYGGLWHNLAGMARFGDGAANAVRSTRDEAAIALAASVCGEELVDPVFDEVFQSVPATRICDLGCGSGERLIRWASKYKDLHCIGIDISPDAARTATSAVSRHNLDDRISIITADVRSLVRGDWCASIELLVSVFMGHDLWPRKNCIATLERLKTVFPAARRFLLCDTHRSCRPLAPDTQIFTMGFEISHAIMNQSIPSVDEWIGVFGEAGWRCSGIRDTKIPYSTIFDLRYS